MDAIKAEIARTGKPGIVFVSHHNDPGSQIMKERVNLDEALLTSLDQFVVGNPETQELIDQWQFPGEKHTYLPRVYLLDTDGNIMDIKGSQERFPRVLSHAREIKGAMQRVLHLCSIEPVTSLEDEPEIVPSNPPPPPPPPPRPPATPVKPAEPEVTEPEPVEAEKPEAEEEPAEQSTTQMHRMRGGSTQKTEETEEAKEEAVNEATAVEV